MYMLLSDMYSTFSALKQNTVVRSNVRLGESQLCLSEQNLRVLLFLLHIKLNILHP